MAFDFELRLRLAMDETKKLQFETPAFISMEEDSETLAAIDAGLADAEAEKTVDAGTVRKLLRRGQR